MGMIDPRMRRDPVIHGHDHLCATGVGLIDHFRAEAVAVFKPVRHQVSHIIAAQRTQAEHAQRGTGCAVGIEIAHHDNPRAFPERVVEHFSRFFDATQRLPGQHAFDAALKIACRTHATAGVQPL
ncbi:Uncharacterised protein [Enterobacter cloacae]|nr:Uncharacterised protein [Enterobacter cloacae]